MVDVEKIYPAYHELGRVGARMNLTTLEVARAVQVIPVCSQKAKIGVLEYIV